jgi:hypothetical protein
LFHRLFRPDLTGNQDGKSDVTHLFRTRLERVPSARILEAILTAQLWRQAPGQAAGAVIAVIAGIVVFAGLLQVCLAEVDCNGQRLSCLVRERKGLSIPGDEQTFTAFAAKSCPFSGVLSPANAVHLHGRAARRSAWPRIATMGRRAG